MLNAWVMEISCEAPLIDGLVYLNCLQTQLGFSHRMPSGCVFRSWRQDAAWNLSDASDRSGSRGDVWLKGSPGQSHRFVWRCVIFRHEASLSLTRNQIGKRIYAALSFRERLFHQPNVRKELGSGKLGRLCMNLCRCGQKSRLLFFFPQYFLNILKRIRSTSRSGAVRACTWFYQRRWLMDVQTTGQGQRYLGNTARTLRTIGLATPLSYPAPSSEDLIKQVYLRLDRLSCGILFLWGFCHC